MKNILLATTALLLTAGIASAEVTLSGDGRMGISYNEFGEEEMNYISRLRTKFTLGSETDNGLTFGGSFRSKDAQNANKGSAGTVFVSGEYGRLEVGDIDGAAEAAVGDLYGVGLAGNGDFNEFDYISQSAEAGDPGALYSYKFDTFSFYLSGKDNFDADRVRYRKDPLSGNLVNVGMGDDREVSSYAVGAQFEAEGFTFGAGYESLQNDDINDADVSQWALSIEGDVQGFGVKVAYAVADADANAFNNVETRTQYGISVKYEYMGTEVFGFYRQVEAEYYGTQADTDIGFTGLGVAYDLGGGAEFKAGVADSDEDGVDPRADFGLSFSF